MHRAICSHDLGHTDSHTHSRTNKPPTAGVQLVGNTSINKSKLLTSMEVDIDDSAYLAGLLLPSVPASLRRGPDPPNPAQGREDPGGICSPSRTTSRGGTPSGIPQRQVGRRWFVSICLTCHHCKQG